MTSTDAHSSTPVPHLQRVLTLWDLIFYGIVMIMPIAPVPLFGLIQKLSRGHTVTTILIAMVAMMLTAVSYGRMAAVYPSAGSAYTYVGRGLNPHLGFLTGWTMFFDYLLIPILDTIYGALTVERLVGPLLPHVPPRVLYTLLAALFAGTMTVLNLRGIRATARANVIMLVVMCGVIGVFILRAIQYLYMHEGWSGVLSTQPFYNPMTFDIRVIATGTSFAALTYVGFDGVTTLAEDAINPKRNILIATVLVCLFTGLFGGLQVYLAQRVWPDWHTFANLETAFMDVCQRVGGVVLFQALAFILIVANLGGGLTGQVGAARLLYSMGRDNVLPRRFFAHLDPKRSTPTYNILLIGIVAFAGALAMNYEPHRRVHEFWRIPRLYGRKPRHHPSVLFCEAHPSKAAVPGGRARPRAGFHLLPWYLAGAEHTRQDFRGSVASGRSDLQCHQDPRFPPSTGYDRLERDMKTLTHVR